MDTRETVSIQQRPEGACWDSAAISFPKPMILEVSAICMLLPMERSSLLIIEISWFRSSIYNLLWSGVDHNLEILIALGGLHSDFTLQFGANTVKRVSSAPSLSPMEAIVTPSSAFVDSITEYQLGMSREQEAKMLPSGERWRRCR
jgi:hypothetical protein